MGFQVLAPVLPRGLLRVAKNSDFGFAEKVLFRIRVCLNRLRKKSFPGD
jgi:hypothetical protein